MDIDKCKKIISELVQGYEPGSSHWVHITHVNNPHSFYVRPTKYNTLLSNLETDTPTEKINELLMHQRIVFKKCSNSSDQYVRGQIINVDDKGDEVTCDIFALDYGSLHKSILLKNVWKCKDSVVNVPPLAFQCQLANCSPVGGIDWSDDAIEAVKYYFGDERAKMIVIDRLPDKLVIEIVNTCPDDIATLLALTGFSTLGYSHNMISRMSEIPTKKNFYNFRNISVNETLCVRMQCGSSVEEFYVAEVNDYLRYKNNQEMVTHRAKKEMGISDGELVKGLPVCILDDLRKCERAIVKSILPSKSEAIVQLVDTGKEVKAHTINMRHMPEVCLTDAACAIFCSTTEHQLLDTRLHRFLQPGYQFLITIKELGHQFDSPNIVTITALDKQ